MKCSGTNSNSNTGSGTDESEAESSYSLRDSALRHHSIEDTGMYIILFGVCGPFTSPVQVQGTIESMDPCKCSVWLGVCVWGLRCIVGNA